MKVLEFDPALGAARQGDIIIWRLPAGFSPSKQQQLAARDGRLILAEGEATGHHHSVLARAFDPPRFRDDAMARAAEAEFRPATGAAALYRDDELTRKLTQQHLTTGSLCVGYLRVEHAPVIVEHQEHDAIRVPPGEYYVGRQQEFNAGEMRRVRD